MQLKAGDKNKYKYWISINDKISLTILNSKQHMLLKNEYFIHWQMLWSSSKYGLVMYQVISNVGRD